MIYVNPTFAQSLSLAGHRRLRGVHRGDKVGFGPARDVSHDSIATAMGLPYDPHSDFGTYQGPEAFFLTRQANGDVTVATAHLNYPLRPFSRTVQGLVDDMRQAMEQHDADAPVPSFAYAEAF